VPGAGTVTPGMSPASGGVTFQKGLALRQAESLAGMQIEDIAVPDPGAGMPVQPTGTETVGPGEPPQLTEGGTTTTEQVPTPDPVPDEVAQGPAESGTGAGEGAGVTPEGGGTAPASGPGTGISGTFTAEPAAVSTTTTGAGPSVIGPDGAIPEGGVGITQGPPDTPPPPTPSGGVNPALVVAGVAGGAAVVAGTVALAVGGGGIGGLGYHCGEGSSWCPTVGKCCPTGYIHGVWGAYYIPGHGCYKSAESAAQAAAYYKTANVHGCADERRNQ